MQGYRKIRVIASTKPRLIRPAELGLPAQKGFYMVVSCFSGTLVLVFISDLGYGRLCPTEGWHIDFMLHLCLETGWEWCWRALQVPSRGPWSFWIFAHPMAQASCNLCAYVGSALQRACPEKYNRAVLLFHCFRFLCHSSHKKHHQQRTQNK